MDNINSFFDYLVSQEAKINNTKEYPNYDRIIYNYRSFFNAGSYRLESYNMRPIHTYSIPFKLLGDCEFELKLNISHLIKILSDFPTINIETKDYINYFKLHSGKDVERKIFSKNELLSMLDEEDISKIHVNYAKKCINRTDPIICGDFTWVTPDRYPPAYILDGNHRVYGKISSGITEIDGYYVSRNIWYHALLRDIDKRFIKVLSNINLLISYQNGRISNVFNKMYIV